MKKMIVLITVILLISFFSGAARSELIDKGNGLIYDTILDITWLTYANYAGVTMTWYDAVSWADDLVYSGYDDWRLPTSDASCTGSGCTGSEMGNLYYYYNITSDTPLMFTDVKPYMYWSATEYGQDTTEAWRFNFGTGYQGTSLKTYTRYAWAVRDGDSTPPVIPEPASMVLFIAGGISLAAGRFRKT
jgi:hypothetical protein